DERASSPAGFSLRAPTPMVLFPDPAGPAPCPRRELLEQFLQEGLDPGTATDLGDHLETCPVCQKALEEMDRPVAGLDPGPRKPAWVPQPGFLQRLEDLTRKPRAEPAGPPSSPPVPPTDLPAIPGYRLVSILGQGGMGTVFEAVQEGLGRP